MLPKIIRLDIRLEDANTVKDLKMQVHALTDENIRLREQLRRTDYNLRCQQLVNLQLSDYCMEHHYDIPKRLYKAVFKD